MRKHLNRVNSDLAQYHKELPKIQNDYFNFNIRHKNKNHFSSQVYSNKNLDNIHNNKNKNGFFQKINI